jgi:hypothetical protein
MKRKNPWLQAKGFSLINLLRDHSHSMVAGGLLDTS